MSSLRKLSAIYIAAASAYAVAIACTQHPQLAQKARETGAAAVRIGGEVAIALDRHVIEPGWAAAKVEVADLSRRLSEAAKPAPQRAVQAVPDVLPKPKPTVVAKVAPPAPRLIRPLPPPPALRPEINDQPAPSALPAQAAPPPQAVASAPSPRVEFDLAPQPPAANNFSPTPPPAAAAAAAANPPPSPAELARVSDRLRDSLTAEMLANFDLFLYVSKAANGPWAQRMYVFDKRPNGDLAMLYNWPVSTGREKVEFNAAGLRLPSYTPAGYYELDPHRIFTHYNSMQWNQPMPYAMFFNWVHDGSKTGLAIHGATGEDIGLLGTRASAGCIRLAPENARLLFTLIREHYKGPVPRFDFDKRTATMANNGLLLHDAGGQLEFQNGYKVLVFVEDFGGENVVAALF